MVSARQGACLCVCLARQRLTQAGSRPNAGVQEDRHPDRGGAHRQPQCICIVAASLAVAGRRAHRGIQDVLSHEARESNKACRYSDCTESTTLQYLSAISRLRFTETSRFATLTVTPDHMSFPAGALLGSSKHSDQILLNDVSVQCGLAAPTLSRSPFVPLFPVSCLLFSMHFLVKLFRFPGPSQARPSFDTHAFCTKSSPL